MLTAAERRRLVLGIRDWDLTDPAAMATEDASILLSFVHRPETQSRIRVTTSIGNLIRKLLRRDRVEPGDYLAPNYVHYFSKEQIEAELLEVGFQFRFYSTDPHGHAIGVSMP